MTNVYKLIQLAKEKQGIASDNAFAIKYGFGRSHISNWKAGFSAPNALSYLKIAKAAGLGIDEALSLLEAEESSKKEAGFSTLPMMGTLSAMSLLIVSPTPEALLGVAFGALFVANIHYATQ